jgi:hypothetical protein
VLGKDGHNNGWVFRALRFVDGYGVGKDNFIEIAEFKRDIPAVKGDDQLLVLLIDLYDSANVAVKDLFVVIVFDLWSFLYLGRPL